MSKSTDNSEKPQKKSVASSKKRKSTKLSSENLDHTPVVEPSIALPDDEGDGAGLLESDAEQSFQEEEHFQISTDELDEENELNPNPRDIFAMESDEELLNRVAGVYQIWWNWAHFELSIVSPYTAPLDICEMILPEQLSDSEFEFVYPIADYGNKLITSKAPEMYSVGMSMCKLYYTIEKMIAILIERLKQDGVSTETEIQIAFDGHQLAQRKAFESVINLSYNVVVTNFDPGVWGERYLATIKRLAEKGYGYPSEAPRDSYRNFGRTSIGAKR